MNEWRVLKALPKMCIASGTDERTEAPYSIFGGADGETDGSQNVQIVPRPVRIVANLATRAGVPPFANLTLHVRMSALRALGRNDYFQQTTGNSMAQIVGLSHWYIEWRKLQRYKMLEHGETYPSLLE